MNNTTLKFSIDFCLPRVQLPAQLSGFFDVVALHELQYHQIASG